MELYFTKLDGKVTTSLKECFSTLPDGDYKIKVEKARKIRSPEQNARYWVILNLLESQNVGYTAQEWHLEMKKRLLKPRIVKSKLDGRKRIKRHPSTALLTTQEFSEYNEKIVRFAVDFFGVDFNQFL